jgi:hypothetical protein
MTITTEEAIKWHEQRAAASRIAALEAENARLREDKDRLDFLDACNQRLNSTCGTSYGWKMVVNHNVNRLMTGHHLDVDLNDFEGFGAKSCRQAIDAERRRVEGARRAAPPTSELESENARLKARVAELEKALHLFEQYGCPVCHGDCASANPPVYSCPMQAASRVRQGG